MQKLIQEIDGIVDETTSLVSQVFSEYSKQTPKLDDNFEHGAAWMLFQLGREYFISARDELKSSRVVSGASLVRSCIENMSDAYYIYDTPGKLDKYTKSYVNSMYEFQKIMFKAKDKTTLDIYESQLLKEANKWTDANISQRISATGPGLSNIYDLLSYASHPNPGSITYLGNPNLRKKQINYLKQSNCLTMLSLLMLVLNHSDIKCISRSDVKKLLSKINPQFL